MKKTTARRATQRDIAVLCGVSQMTVSLVLRGHPKISAAVRQRVLQAAKKLKWRPDPVLSALMNYRHGTRNSESRAVIAWVTNWPTRTGWRDDHPVYLAYYQGAAARAAQLGYRIEEFWLAEPGMTAARLSRILHARNITGLLLPPQPRAHAHLHLAWERFAAVTFGFTLARPSLHVATNHHFRSAVLAMRKLRSLGYRRVGVLLDRRYDERVGYSWMAGCLVEQRRYAAMDIPPVLSLSRLTPDELLAYVRRHRVDALLTNFRDAATWLRDLNIAVPKELGLAFLAVTERNPDFSGVSENSFAIGEAGLDLLATMIQRHEVGIPALPRRVMIEGFWNEGKTVRRVNKPGRAAMEFGATASG